MDNAKIQFSADELRLVTDEQVILTKNRIIEKISIFFGLLQSCYRIKSADIFSSLGIVQQPKISRGENYNGLPYVILDYPRHFTKEDIFAIRTMFLWGNDFSITLHLKGRYKKLFEEPLIKNAPLLKIVDGICRYPEMNGSITMHTIRISPLMLLQPMKCPLLLQVPAL